VASIKYQVIKPSAAVRWDVIEIFLLLIFSALSGCGAGEGHDVISDLHDSQTAYRECLIQVDGDATKCAAQQQSYQAAREIYEQDGPSGKSVQPSN
jgi:hypothetical protein